jgi:Nuclear cap-binding protein subunit 3
VATQLLPFLDTTYRPNALLLQGPPISHLPTSRLFAYATHFDTHPMGLEWVDDNTCVFVFPSKTSARTAHRNLRKASIEEPDASGFITAKPIPITFWPPEERINTSLGKGQGLKGTLRMRWALIDDIKKKGAKRESAFYKKHGRTAGKEVYGKDTNNPQPAKRRRRGENGTDSDVANMVTKEELDEQLDEFLAEDEEPEPPQAPSPPSKMRSDYIATDGRTLLERTSVIRAHPGPEPESLADRIMAPLPRRARNEGGGGGGGGVGKMYSESLEERVSRPEDILEWGKEKGREKEDMRPRRRERGAGGRSRDGRQRQARTEQPRSKTQQELDDELEAFLNEKE